MSQLSSAVQCVCNDAQSIGVPWEKRKCKTVEPVCTFSLARHEFDRTSVVQLGFAMFAERGLGVI